MSQEGWSAVGSKAAPATDPATLATLEYWTPQQLREFLQLARPGQYKTWSRVKVFFAPALVVLPSLKRYHVAKVRALLAGKSSRQSPLHRHTSLRKLKAAS